jgi:hypothetical protein
MRRDVLTCRPGAVPRRPTCLLVTQGGHSHPAKCLHFPAEYEYVGPRKILPTQPFQKVPRRAFVRDVALIVLKDDVNNIPLLELDSEAIHTAEVTLVHASHPADRQYMLTANFGCRLLSEIRIFGSPIAIRLR